MMNRRRDVAKPEQMIDRLWFEPTTTEDVPTEYYVPAAATTSLELLRAHGVQMRQLTAPVSGVEQFAITSNTQRPPTGSIDTRHARAAHARRHVGGRRRRHGAGRRVGRADEPAARAARVLPARADVRRRARDWNFLDEMLGADVKVYPILRKK